MKLGIFSDLHDNLSALERILHLFRERGVERMIFCGDFCSPIPLRQMAASGIPLDAVFGNNDGERFLMERFAADQGLVVLHGEHADLRIEGRRIAVTHYPFYGEALAKSGDFDAVFSGHSHQMRMERYGDSLWLNPGEGMGWQGAPTCAIYDTQSNSAEVVELEGVGK